MSLLLLNVSFSISICHLNVERKHWTSAMTVCDCVRTVLCSAVLFHNLPTEEGGGRVESEGARSDLNQLLSGRSMIANTQAHTHCAPMNARDRAFTRPLLHNLFCVGS